MTLLFLAALGTVVVSFVLYPVLSREVTPAEESSTDEGTPELLRLAEAKQRLLESVKDVEFEYKAGKLSEADYQRVRADDLAQVAQIMARIDEITEMTGNKKTTPGQETTTAEPETTASVGSEEGATICKSCRQGNPAEARFCLRCGKAIPHTLECSKCGTELPAEAQFCIRCGTAVQT